MGLLVIPDVQGPLPYTEKSKEVDKPQTLAKGSMYLNYFKLYLQARKAQI